MTRKTIRAILQNAGIKRSKGEQTIYYHLTSTLREDAFDVINDESAYWLGFLYADGYITNPKTTPAVGVLLKLSDIGHIQKFKDFMKAPQQIRVYEKYPNASIRIGSQTLHKRLMQLGFTNTKSYDADPPEILKYNRHFWRGVVDGDGHLGMRPTKWGIYTLLHLCGTEMMVSAFRNFMILSGVDTDAKIRRKNDESPLCIFEISAGLAKGAARILYEGATTYLDRKYETYQKYFAK